MDQNWPFVAGVVALLAAAFGALAYFLVLGGTQIVFLGAALGLVAVALVLLLAMQLRSDASARQRERRAGIAQRKSRSENESTLQRLRELETHRLADSDTLAELKTSYAALQRAMAAKPAKTEAAAPAFVETAAPPIQVHATIPPVAKPRGPSLASQLHFALEPVIDIPTQRTAHYRLHPAMDMADGELTDETLFRHCAARGQRQELDEASITEALHLLEHLRQRDPQLCLLVPIGLETLRTPEAVARLVETCELSPEAAQGLRLEMHHIVLAGISGTGLEGLASLARRGLGFALSNVSVAGLDLDAMKLLNIRFAAVSANAMGDAGPTPDLVSFAQMARMARVNVVVTDVTEASLVAKLASVSRLVCGPCFAPPRRVRRMSLAPQTPTTDYSLAA